MSTVSLVVGAAVFQNNREVYTKPVTSDQQVVEAEMLQARVLHFVLNLIPHRRILTDAGVESESTANLPESVVHVLGHFYFSRLVAAVVRFK